MTATINNQDFITATRNLTTQFWNAYTGLISMQTQWNALSYGTTLMDGTGTNSGVTAAEVGSVLFDSMNAITTVFNTGVATDLAEVKFG